MKIHHTVEQNPKEKEASARGRKAHKDGHGFEDEMVAFLRAGLPDCFRIQRHEPGDILIFFRDEPFMFIQCKDHKRPNIRAALRLARQVLKGSASPAALTRAEGETPILSVEVRDFAWLLATANLKENTEPEQGERK